MKRKILKYTFLFLIPFLVQSCSLDETILDRPTPKTITSEKDVDALIAGIYSRFNDPIMFKYLGHIMLTLNADDIFSVSAGDFGPYGKRQLTSTNTAPMWQGMYLTINNTNNLIATLDNIELSEAFEKRAYGEAYFIRAFCYYYLVRLYGGVPLRLTPTTSTSDFYMQRATLEETYQQIFEDFNAAASMLPLRSALADGQIGRGTKGAAQALLAQAHLTYGDQLLQKGGDATPHFTNAAAYADSVINSGQYTLMKNLADLYDVKKEIDAYKNEVIFGIRFQADAAASGQAAAGSEYALRFNVANTHNVVANGANKAGDGSYRVMHWFAEYYLQGDYANDSVIDYRNEVALWQTAFQPGTNRTYYVYPRVVPVGSGNYTIPQPVIRKYIDPDGIDSRNNNNDFFVIRMAEIYYIKAEALNELNGPTQQAIDAFNIVRKRAQEGSGVARAVPLLLSAADGLTKESFRMKIFDDRGLELLGEGQRWFDLVRMPSPLGDNVTMYEYQFLHRLNNKLTGYPVYTTHSGTMPTYNNTTKLYSFYNSVYEETLKVSVPKFLLFPIPNAELIQNKKFGNQNPQW